MALWSLPTKAARKEINLTVLLITTAVSSAVLAMPGNIAYLVYTNFPDVWNDFEKRCTRGKTQELTYSLGSYS